MIQYLTAENFVSTIKENKVVMVDFYADWCIDCRVIDRSIEELDTEYEGKAVIAKVDVAKYQELADQFGIRNIPTMFYFKDGEMVEKQVGGVPGATVNKQTISETIDKYLK